MFMRLAITSSLAVLTSALGDVATINNGNWQNRGSPSAGGWDDRPFAEDELQWFQNVDDPVLTWTYAFGAITPLQVNVRSSMIYQSNHCCEMSVFSNNLDVMPDSIHRVRVVGTQGSGLINTLEGNIEGPAVVDGEYRFPDGAVDISFLVTGPIRMKTWLSGNGAGTTDLVMYFEPCQSDLNNDLILDVFDVLLFLGHLSLNDPIADWNADTTIDIFDVVAYLGDFESGC